MREDRGTGVEGGLEWGTTQCALVNGGLHPWGDVDGGYGMVNQLRVISS